jgi:hypothetical protein
LGIEIKFISRLFVVAFLVHPKYFLIKNLQHGRAQFPAKITTQRILSSFAAGAALNLGSLTSLTAQAGEQGNNHIYADADEWVQQGQRKT